MRDTVVHEGLLGHVDAIGRAVQLASLYGIERTLQDPVNNLSSVWCAAACKHRANQKALNMEFPAPLPASLPEYPPVTWVEWDHLRFRVVALESLLVALLAEGAASRLHRLGDVVNHMPPHIPGVEHALSELASAQAHHMLDRARRLQQQPLF